MSPTSAFSSLLLLVTPVATSLVACGPSDEEQPQEVSCEDVARDFAETCSELLGPDSAELFAEEFRVDCIAMDGDLDDDARCIAKAHSCEEVLECEVGSIEFSCDTDEDCGNGLFCSEDPVDCVACLLDSDCETSQRCLSGLCVDEGNSFLDTAP